MNPVTEQDYQHIIRQQAETIQRQQLRIAELEKQVAELSAQVARLSKNSSNSSKPPSSDIVKPLSLPKTPSALVLKDLCLLPGARPWCRIPPPHNTTEVL
jgi:hypothetical protein